MSKLTGVIPLNNAPVFWNGNQTRLRPEVFEDWVFDGNTTLTVTRGIDDRRLVIGHIDRVVLRKRMLILHGNLWCPAARHDIRSRERQDLTIPGIRAMTPGEGPPEHIREFMPNRVREPGEQIALTRVALVSATAIAGASWLAA